VTKITEPAHSFMYQPSKLQLTRPLVDTEHVLGLVSGYLKHPFNNRQEEAFRKSFTERLSLLWGPPGTGKTVVLAGIILGWIEDALERGSSIIIGVGSSNYNAIDNVLSEVADLLDRRQKMGRNGFRQVRVIRIRSESAKPPRDDRLEDIFKTAEEARTLVDEISDPTRCIIVGGTWMQLSKLSVAYAAEKSLASKWFDLIVIDEASQVPVSSAAAYFLLLKEEGHVVLAGDHKQLGPIYSFEMRNSDRGLFDCIFSYMQDSLNKTPVSLDLNYRTNIEISGWPRVRFYPQGYEAFRPERQLRISLPTPTGKPPAGWPTQLAWSDQFLRILDPNIPVVVICYGAHTSTLSNQFEAQIVASLAVLYRHVLCQEDKFDDSQFWDKCLGIVTPHRAQMSNIRNILVSDAGISMDPPPFVDTVDRFQGQERDLMIASYAVADRDFVAAEESFILDPRRFNVTLTRAKSKFIMLISDAILQHLPSDADVARDAAHLQLFVESYCTSINENIELPYIENGQVVIKSCRLKGRRDAP